MSDDEKPYNSFGNGAAMRVSPCAWVMSCGSYARIRAWPSNRTTIISLSAEVTHNPIQRDLSGDRTAGDHCVFGKYGF